MALQKRKKRKNPMQKRKNTSTRSSDISIRTRKRRLSPQALQRRRQRALLTGIFLGLCICLLAFSVFKLVSILLGYAGGSKEYKGLQQYVLEEPVEPGSQEFDQLMEEASSGDEGSEEDSDAFVRLSRIDLASLQEINPDGLGWIEIPGTNISYPIVQGTDNSYYLTHTFTGEENKSGSIFVEAMNSGDFSDLHTIIYGHNMKNGSMFANLKNYKKESYYQAHPYVYIDLADGSHCYQIFSCYEAATTDNVYTVGYSANDKYAEFLNGLVASSLYSTGVDVSIDDKVVTLSTCTSNGKNRFVVCAKKIY